MESYRKTQLARKGTFIVVFRSNGRPAFPHKWAKAAAAAYHILCNVHACDYGLYEVAEGTRHEDKITYKDGVIRGDFRRPATLTHTGARRLIDRALKKKE